MFIHDIIKIKYVREGYLQDYPYRMISDNDMFDAFVREGGYFDTTYPCPDESLDMVYATFKDDLFAKIAEHIEEGTELGAWVYSYMLGNAIGPNSDETDIEYINELLNTDDPITTEYCKLTAEAVYEVSMEWLKKMNYKYEGRVPTIFAEPYIIKSLRLAGVDVLGG